MLKIKFFFPFLIFALLAPLVIEAEEEKASPPQISAEPPAPETKKVTIQDFKQLNSMLSKYESLSDQEQKMRLDLSKAKRNFEIAKNNFKDVLDIKTLIEDIRKNNKCYITYHRIKDLDNRIKSYEGNIAVLNEIKAPLTVFLNNCGEIRIDLLNKYQEETL